MVVRAEPGVLLDPDVLHPDGRRGHDVIYLCWPRAVPIGPRAQLVAGSSVHPCVGYYQAPLRRKAMHNCRAISLCRRERRPWYLTAHMLKIAHAMQLGVRIDPQQDFMSRAGGNECIDLLQRLLELGQRVSCVQKMR